MKVTDDESICMIPSKMVVLRDGQSLMPDQTYHVLWTDKKNYVVWISAVGKSKNLHNVDVQYTVIQK